TDNGSWSTCGAERAQTVATGGKSLSPENGSNKPKPLPSVAVSCVHKYMVRRGSTVRVRQRASLFSLLYGWFCCRAWRRVVRSDVHAASTSVHGSIESALHASSGCTGFTQPLSPTS